MRAVCGALALALGVWLAAAAGAAPAAPVVVTNPDWLQRPSGEDFERFYPELALGLEMPGAVTLSCIVNEFGQLTRCAVTSESPKDLGFGAAALAMAEKFRMKPMTRDGQPVAGGTVRIPLRFYIPMDDPPVRAADSLSQQSLALGRRYVDLLHLPEATQEEVDRTAREWEFLEIPDTPADSRAAAADALRAATRARLDEVREAYARAAAATFSEPELRQIVTVMETPAGAAIRPNAMLEAVQQMIAQESWRRLQEVAHDVFCRARNCAPTAAFLRVADAAGEATVGDPAWSEQPSEVQLWSALPKFTMALGVQGAARLTCLVTREGLLDSCKVAAEAPEGLGFGAAALSLAGYYRLSGFMMAQGAERESAAVRVVFPQPPMSEPFASLTPRSEKALDLARKLVRSGLAPGDPSADLRGQVDAFVGDLQHLSPDVRDDVRGAISEGAQRASEGLQEDLARAYAAEFSEDQLAAALAFFSSPAGRAAREKQELLSERFAAAAMRVETAIRSDAREAYCRARVCAQSIGASPDASTRNP